MTTWYYAHRSTIPSTFYEVDDLLQTMTIHQRGKSDEVVKRVGATSLTVVPIASLGYVLIFGTKLYTVTSGTLILTLVATTDQTVVLYVQDTTTNQITTYSVTGNANAIRTQTLNLSAGVEYVILGVYANTFVNNALFIQTTFTGTYVDKNRAYRGGNGVVLTPSASTVFAVGDYKWSARTADFDGWLLCDGREIYRDAYPALFATIGTSFGAGNGTTTFKLPDGRGRVPGMTGNGAGLTARNMGQAIGEETHMLTANEIPAHTHTGTTNTTGAHSHSINDPGHTHTQTTVNDDFNNSGGNPPGFTGDSAGTRTWYNINASTTGISINSNGDHSHTFTTSSVGGGLAHNVMQPTLFIGNLFICAEV